MPIGIIVNSSCVLIGGLLGSKFGKYMPTKMRESLSLLFGFSSIAIGVSLLENIQILPAIILALIMGTIIGEGFKIEKAINSCSLCLKTYIEKWTHQEGSSNEDSFTTNFGSLLMLFCTGTTGILGALGEGMTGDSTVLLTKSVMDVFASFSFAASMGIIVASIAVPQFILFLLLFLGAGVIMPLASVEMIGDFMACGGILAIITGFRICNIKHFRVTNALPSLVLVMPISWLWATLF